MANMLKDFYDKIAAEDYVLCYDMETTGLYPKPKENNPAYDKMIQLTARVCHFEDGKLEELSSENWYFNPGFAIAQNIVDMTGITNEFLETQPTEEEQFKNVSRFFSGMPIIGYNNQKFDDIFMQEMYKRNGKVFTPKFSLDALKAAKLLITPAEVVNYKQGTIAEHYGYTPVRVHTADDDSEALLYVVNGVLKDIEKGNEDKEYNSLIKVRVKKITPWTNPRNHVYRRLYVATDRGDFFFDINDSAWKIQNQNDRIQRYDTEDLEEQVLKATGCRDYTEFGKIKESVIPAA